MHASSYISQLFAMFNLFKKCTIIKSLFTIHMNAELSGKTFKQRTQSFEEKIQLPLGANLNNPFRSFQLIQQHMKADL